MREKGELFKATGGGDDFFVHMTKKNENLIKCCYIKF